MALLFSKNNSVRDPEAIRKEQQAKHLENKRREIINRETVDGVKRAIYRINTRIRTGRADKGNLSENVHVNHWLANSVDRVMFYNKIGDPNDSNDAQREQAIREDIEFFHAIVQRLQASNREWKIEPKYRGSLPNQILVQKK